MTPASPEHGAPAPAAPGADDTHLAAIERLTHDGRGVAHVDGSEVLIDGALPGERVEFVWQGRRRRWRTARLTRVVDAAAERVPPPCPYFGRCGGCTLQHLSRRGQLDFKQTLLLDALRNAGGLAPERVLPPLAGGQWEYRRRARLGVRQVPSKGGVLVGFRERHKSYVTALESCAVLDPVAARLLPALTEVVAALSCPDRIPQIEVAVGDERCALVLRHLQPLADADHERLRRFAAEHDVQLWLQPSDLDSVHCLHPAAPGPLSYRLPSTDVTIVFRATDFVQVNAEVNRALVDRALELLALEAGDSVLDLFCGLGNFTLPCARRAAQATGIEGDLGLVERARDNARGNGIGNARFFYRDLLTEPLDEALLLDRYDKVVLDPPRSGALAVAKAMGRLAPRRIVYVSCNPSTLARDAQLLSRVHGYALRAAGIVDMFPNTAHVEAIAVFERP